MVRGKNFGIQLTATNCNFSALPENLQIDSVAFTRTHKESFDVTMNW